MEIRGLGFYPLLTAFWCVAWLCASYTLTVIHCHAPPLMYISEAGNYFSENLFFDIGFIGLSIATLGLMFLNYKFMLFHSEAFGARQAVIQRILLAIGWSSCAATAVMSGFENAFYPMTHRVCAFIAFGLSGLYSLWQAILLHKVPGSRVISWMRTASCAMAVFCLGILTGFGVSVYTHLCKGDCLKISEPITKSTEWVMIVLILINIFSYYQPMQSLSITVSRKGFTVSRREENLDSGV